MGSGKIDDFPEVTGTKVCRIPPAKPNSALMTGIRSTLGNLFPYSNRIKAGFIILVISVAFAAWCPWISNEYAEDIVVESMGGSDADFFYLGENTTIGDIPIYSIKVPFGVFVYFPGEAMFVVPFWGGVLGVPSLGLGTYGD